MKKMSAMLLLMVALVAPALAADLKADLMAVENTLWTAWGKKDGEPFKTALTTDAVEIVAGTPRMTGRDAIARNIGAMSCDLKSFDLHDADLRELSKSVVVLSYVATQVASCDGQKLPSKVNSTSIYVKQGGKWLQTSYQETPLE
jgi:uncharacterized protein (TIGR02246 family)